VAKTTNFIYHLEKLFRTYFRRILLAKAMLVNFRGRQMAEIVEYSQSDREAVREICFRTGFLGKSLAGIIDYKDLFVDLATHYFLDARKSCIFVAKDSGRVIGYGVIIDDVKEYKISSTKYYIYRVFLDVVRFRLFRKKEFLYYTRLLLYYLKGDFTLPEFYEYPALLHINISDGYQGLGIGSRLFESMFAGLKSKSCSGVQLQTHSANEKSVGFFKKHGFAELASKETKFYQTYGAGVVKTIAMGKKF